MLKPSKSRQLSVTKQYKGKIPFKVKLFSTVRKVLFGFILASFVNFLFSYFFHTPKVYSLEKENYELILKINDLQNRIDFANLELAQIADRDNGIYRAILGVDGMQRESGGSINTYGDSYKTSRHAHLLDKTWRNLDSLSYSILTQSLSFDTIQSISADKERVLDALPAIWPIDKKSLRGRIGVFGTRVHPIFRYRHKHTGVDLPAATGTPVYATAKGVVESVKYESGYGRNIVVDHGFGYKTRYAHLSKWHIEKGDEVARGTLIGEVGSTGYSTGPHLHYEVIYKREVVNPLTFLGKEVKDEDFYNIINSAKETTYELLDMSQNSLKEEYN